MKPNNSAYRSLFSPVLTVGLLLLCFIAGCSHRPDSRLIEIDAMMESSPDSALILLNAFKFDSTSTPYDKALYGLLLTHARYKNFIDETDDSLISYSAEYFVEHGDKELAARSLFLKGMIQMNANKLGESAVSFTKGLDLSRECKSYMWEGQCARGLFMVYTELNDGSVQIKYAEQSRDAFMKGGSKDWIDYSALNLARAYNNNGQYGKALSIADKLIELSSEEDDMLILLESMQLEGASLFMLGRFKESLEMYSKILEIDPSVIKANDRYIIESDVYETYGKSIPDSISRLLNLSPVDMGVEDVFVILANEGRYKDAYESLKRYKNEQDSVLELIARNNVSESIGNYEANKYALVQMKLKNERMSYWVLLLLLGMVCLIVYLRYRNHIFKEESMRLKTEADIESLRHDLQSQLESAKETLGNSLNDSDHEQTIGFEDIIRRRYAEANRLCDDYYQGGVSRKNDEGVHAEIHNIIRSFTEKDSLEKVAEYVDEKSGGLYSSFKKDFFRLPDDSHRLFLYIMLGLSSRTLSVIIGQSINAVYTKKSRLKTKIEQSDVAEKNIYLSFFKT